MPKLPVPSGLETVKVLTKAGFKVARRKGSHVSLYKESSEGPRIVVIPLHRELKPGTLRGIIRQAGMSVEEFVALLR